MTKILQEKQSKLESIRKEKAKIEENEQMKECTFAPAYHSLHASKDPTPTHNTADRLINWQRERDQKIMRIAIHQDEKLALVKSSTETCTLLKIQESSERLNNQQRIKTEKLSKLITESEELLFMPIINKKSRMIGRSKVARQITHGETLDRD